MTDHHPLTETAVAELWNTSRFPGSAWADRYQEMHHDDRDTALAALRAAFDAGRDQEREREHADPFHDPRPWQDCTVEDIQQGDLVEARSGDRLHIGTSHHKDEHGDWDTEHCCVLTLRDRWTLRRIPARTTPAEEVELPAEHPAHITDAENDKGDTCAHMALDRIGDWRGVDQGGYARDWPPHWLTSFTLPDGTRARRDGEHEDGTPRFVKVQEGRQ